MQFRILGPVEATRSRRPGRRRGRPAAAPPGSPARAPRRARRRGQRHRRAVGRAAPGQSGQRAAGRRLAAAHGRRRGGDRLARGRLRARARRPRGGRRRSLRAPDRGGRGRARLAASPPPPPTRCTRRWRCGAARRCTSCATSPSPSAEVARLDEMRLACLGARIEADLALGRHEQRARRAHGARRRAPAARVAPAAARAGARELSGRRAEALDAARGARRALADDLGLAPSPALAALLDGVEREQALPARRQVVCVAADVRCAEERRAARSRGARGGDALLQRRGGGPCCGATATRWSSGSPTGSWPSSAPGPATRTTGVRAVRAATALQRRLGELECEARAAGRPRSA